MIDYLIAGGPVMVPIVLCSVLSLAIIVERCLALRDSRVIPATFVGEAKRLVAAGQEDELIELTKRSRAPIAKLFQAAVLYRNLPGDTLRQAVEAVGKEQAERLSRFLTALSTIASISPLLGLLGTVTGMIRVFNIICTKGVTNPSDLASGISEALITTVAGLVVAIPTLIAYNALQKRTNSYIMRMEQISLAMVSKLMQDKQEGGAIPGEGAIQIDKWIKIDRE